jgi:hypothetical protein
MWISTQVILVGAEINVILDRGIDKKPKAVSDAGSLNALSGGPSSQPASKPA